MPSATAAVPVRPLLLAVFFAVLATFVFAGSADGGARSWSAYLAPAAACPGSTDATASAAVQRRAVTCLMNFARAQHQRGRLSQSSSLRRASVLKGQKVASCGQFSHTPCGSDVTAPVKAAGYRYASFGENLFGGVWGSVTPHDVVAAWLQSPGHRANVLRRGYRHVGADFVRADGLFSSGPEVVWIATFASPR